METTQKLEIRFTAKRALYWNNGNQRWTTIGHDKATAMLALGSARPLS